MRSGDPTGAERDLERGYPRDAEATWKAWVIPNHVMLPSLRGYQLATWFSGLKAGFHVARHFQRGFLHKVLYWTDLSVHLVKRSDLRTLDPDLKRLFLYEISAVYDDFGPAERTVDLLLNTPLSEYALSDPAQAASWYRRRATSLMSVGRLKDALYWTKVAREAAEASGNLKLMIDVSLTWAQLHMLRNDNWRYAYQVLEVQYYNAIRCYKQPEVTAQCKLELIVEVAVLGSKIGTNGTSESIELMMDSKWEELGASRIEPFPGFNNLFPNQKPLLDRRFGSGDSKQLSTTVRDRLDGIVRKLA